MGAPERDDPSFEVSANSRALKLPRSRSFSGSMPGTARLESKKHLPFKGPGDVEGTLRPVLFLYI